MRLFKLGKAYTTDESGAVTVDWVVLTAAICGMALMVLRFVIDGLNTASADIQTEIEESIDEF